MKPAREGKSGGPERASAISARIAMMPSLDGSDFSPMAGYCRSSAMTVSTVLSRVNVRSTCNATVMAIRHRICALGFGNRSLEVVFNQRRSDRNHRSRLAEISILSGTFTIAIFFAVAGSLSSDVQSLNDLAFFSGAQFSGLSFTVTSIPCSLPHSGVCRKKLLAQLASEPRPWEPLSRTVVRIPSEIRAIWVDD